MAKSTRARSSLADVSTGIKTESYLAHKSVKASASTAAVQAAYKIEVRFLGGLTASQKSAFKKAADRWSRVIVGDLPSVVVGGEVIDGSAAGAARACVADLFTKGAAGLESCVILCSGSRTGDVMEGFRRPKMQVLPDAARPPAANLADTPARLTHALAVPQPFFYSAADMEPAGSFKAGRKVTIVSEGDPLCRVVDASGLSVFTPCAGLRALPAPRRRARTATPRRSKRS